MNAIHGKSGNCDPIAGDRYAATPGRSSRGQSTVQTSGVTSTAPHASANVTVMNAPFEMVSGAVNPNFNRAPEAITVAFEPAAPSVNDVVVCRVNTVGGMAREDLDWDIPRYHYVWKVNGQTIRVIGVSSRKRGVGDSDEG